MRRCRGVLGFAANCDLRSYVRLCRACVEWLQLPDQQPRWKSADHCVCRGCARERVVDTGLVVREALPDLDLTPQILNA